MSNSKKRCRFCKEYFDAKGMIRVPLGFFCSFAHAQQHGSEKGKEMQRKTAVKKHKILKESIKSKSQWVQEAEKAVRDYIRLRDSGKPCISCGSLPEQKYGGTMDAGHYRSKGAAKQLRFNTNNIHSQCVKCNRYNSGNAVDYRLGLIKRIGLAKTEQLENDNSIARYEIPYLKRMKEVFKKRRLHLIKIRG